ncbi:MAG: 2,3,4,5-tetrahydropyridine-2,6-dicarboxylate N-succinyltransferase, partial [Gammaproteobacteria bacterium]|nr:2,3,4,5-tetrahydropyridine-2,6-dicarboxylate N-succinyltransferase [Gammaproteobacteria bacterium]
MNHATLQATIEAAFEQRASLDLPNAAPALRSAVATAIQLLDSGEVRVAEKSGQDWIVNQWLKKAVLLHFGIERSARMP